MTRHRIHPSFYGPNGATARVIQTPNDNMIVVTSSNGTTEQYKGGQNSVNRYVSAKGGSATIVNQNGKQTIQLTTANGKTVTFTDTQPYQSVDNTINQIQETMFGTNTYAQSLPPGIPRSQIPPGQEDLYILKSEVVPPVCPRCPDPIVYNQPRIIPNVRHVLLVHDAQNLFYLCKSAYYGAFNQDTMPMPVLNSFSTFGM